MEELTTKLSLVTDNSDLAAFEGKIKEKCYELQLKRNLLAETRSKLHDGLIEKYNLERSLEKTMRECEEIKLQLDVAVQAARRGESERANCRDLLARQSIQLEATTKDRNILQEQIRKMQEENGELKRKLDQSEEKIKSHVHLQETCKIKETQWRSYFDLLQSEIKQLEEAHGRLKEINNSALCAIKKVLFYMTYEKDKANEILNEKNELMKQIVSLSNENEGLNMKLKNENVETKHCNKMHLNEWKVSKQEMENKLRDNEKELLNLQDSLNKALNTINQLQKSENSKDEKIKMLEGESHRGISIKKEHKGLQCCIQEKETDEEIIDVEDEDINRK